MTLLDKLSTILAWTFLCCAAFLSLRPGGVLRTEFAEWRNERATARIIQEEWDSLTSYRPKVESGHSSPMLVEFLDHNCTYCRAFSAMEDSLRNRLPGVRIVLRFHPNPNYPSSRPAAIAVICADASGQLVEMNRFLLTDTAWREGESWTAIGRRAGIRDSTAWLECLDSPEAAAELARDSLWAARLGVVGTPVFVTQRSGVHLGLAPLAEMQLWLEGR